MNDEYDAELHYYTDLGERYIGYIYSDGKFRFTDGQLIKTSSTLRVENGILQTRNTRYKLVD